MIAPAQRLLVFAIAWLLLGLAVTFVPTMNSCWKWSGVALAIGLTLDALWLFLRQPVSVERVLPERFAHGVEAEVLLTIRNHSQRPACIEVFDGIPNSAECGALPWCGEVPASSSILVAYPVRLMQRGDAEFTHLHLRRLSRLGLWTRKTLHLQCETTKVYPNYEPVVKYALLSMQNRENPMGIIRRPRAGSSRDFHQLRDYRDGDPLSQIDWKSTSRRQMLISRDYQEQRDQSVIFLLDTGRRMRAMDGSMPQFDHVLNAILLVSHLALKQGDQIAIKSFGGTDRWFPPMKGSHVMPVLLNHLYDYQTTAEPSDFTGAVESLMVRQRRRSLVVVLTNLRGEDGKELLPALQVLRAKHLVLLASMKEETVRRSMDQPVDSVSSAMRYLAAGRYLQERREIMAALHAGGILTMDATADEFPVRLSNMYFDIKASGRI